LTGGHAGQPGEHVFEISIGIDVAPPAAFDDGVDDRAALAGSRFSDKEPVPFFMLSCA